MKKLLMAAGAAVALGAPGLAHAEANCADLKQASLPHAEVLAATAEKAGNVDACKISIASHPTKDSDIRIELWIPTGAAWNGKFVQVGNGGFAGAISSGQLRRLAGLGYAVAGTDDGHQAPGTSAAWAQGHPEKLIDFGYRALKETTNISKTLIAAQKGSRAKRSYFFGCSDGGREALMEAQRYPTDFDGIVAGAPANYMSQLFGLGALQHQALEAPGGYLDKPALEVLEKAALKQCGDGGSFIRDPAACRFDPAALQCKPGQSGDCLSAGQVASAKAIYDGRRDRTGKVVFPGYAPGAEAEPGSWDQWITGGTADKHAQSLGFQFSSNAFKYFAFGDPNYDFLKMNVATDFDGAAAKMARVIDSASPNLSAFKKHGGKLIQYHGWNDPAIPPRSSIRYYEDVRKTMGDTSGFYRLFLVPGMLHCGGGPGPSNVDWLAKLDAWVTAGEAPKEVTATGRNGASQLVCAYPGVARKAGETWSCATGGGRQGK
jgi:feruloyl esterase